MKTYDNNIQSKLSTFFKKSFKQKINLIFVFLGIKLLVRKILYLLLTFFIKSKISFFKNIIFDINKEKSKYVFYEEKEKFILFTNDEVISKECFVNDDFEFKKFIKVVEFLKKKDYKIRKLYDIGANIGVTCIPAVNRGLVNQAVAIEPEPENFKLLKLNINLNNLENKIQTFNYALSSEDDKFLNLEISNKNSGAHRILLSDKINQMDKKNFKQVRSKTFDSLFSNINFKEDLIWIDSQGHEVNILNGSENLITSGAPIVIEFWPYGLKQNNAWDKMKQTLKRFNFYCDLSNDSMELLEVNNENIEKLFSNWDKENPNKHSLFTDLLLLSNK